MTNNITLETLGVVAPAGATAVTGIWLPGFMPPSTNLAGTFSLTETTPTQFSGTSILGLADGIYRTETRKCTAATSVSFQGSTNVLRTLDEFTVFNATVYNGNVIASVGTNPVNANLTKILGTAPTTSGGPGVLDINAIGWGGAAVLGVPFDNSVPVNIGSLAAQVAAILAGQTATANVPFLITGSGTNSQFTTRALANGPTGGGGGGTTTTTVTALGYVYDANGTPLAAQTVEYRVLGGFGASGIVDRSVHSVVSDSTGLISVVMIRGFQYQLRYNSGDFVEFDAPITGNTASLSQVLGRLQS